MYLFISNFNDGNSKWKMTITTDLVMRITMIIALAVTATATKASQWLWENGLTGVTESRVQHPGILLFINLSLAERAKIKSQWVYKDKWFGFWSSS